MNYKAIDILKTAVEKGASDIYIVAGGPISYKINGNMTPMKECKLTHLDTEDIIKQIYEFKADESFEKLKRGGDDDFSISINELGRFRCNAYKQRGSYACVLRVVRFELPDFHELNIPETVIDLCNMKKGLVLVTGPAGSGKSTTLASLVDRINTNYCKHIITIEDPIEYIHRHKKSIVSQREVDIDTKSYEAALRGALRQSPDVVLLGEMRDFETIQIAITAAETGQLVLSTLHTIGAAKTVDRIIDVFPAQAQQQVRIQLSMVLQAVVSQQLIPTVNGGLVPAFEIMIANSAIRNMIRESKVHMLDNAIYAGSNEGMITMDTSLYNLYENGIISKENAIFYATNKDTMEKRLS
jgi:twitching motility protein PilT